jgi:hypothetical protein
MPIILNKFQYGSAKTQKRNELIRKELSGELVSDFKADFWQIELSSKPLMYNGLQNRGC